MLKKWRLKATTFVGSPNLSALTCRDDYGHVHRNINVRVSMSGYWEENLGGPLQSLCHVIMRLTTFMYLVGVQNFSIFFLFFIWRWIHENIAGPSKYTVRPWSRASNFSIWFFLFLPQIFLINSHYVILLPKQYLISVIILIISKFS